MHNKVFLTAVSAWHRLIFMEPDEKNPKEEKPNGPVAPAPIEEELAKLQYIEQELHKTIENLKHFGLAVPPELEEDLRRAGIDKKTFEHLSRLTDPALRQKVLDEYGRGHYPPEAFSTPDNFITPGPDTRQ